MAERHALFTAEVNPTSANNFVKFLLDQVTAGTTRLILAMNCPGGQVTSGIAIHNTMLAMPYQIVTHNIGNVDSIANVIFLAGAERYACQAATFMFHSVGLIPPNGLRLEETNLRAFLDSIVSDHTRISALIAARSKISAEDSLRLFREQRTRDATWARENGIIADIRQFAYPAGGKIELITQ